MSRKIIGGLLSLLILAVLMVTLWSVVSRARAAATAQTVPGDLEPRRERQGDSESPNISFIDNPTAQCVRPEQHTDACYIQWNYLNVTASTSQYILTMTVTIDDRLRSYYSGFFQSSMYVPQELHNPGFRVACGLPGEGGNPQLGRAYSYAVRARETGGLSAANYGTVICPADVVPVDQVSVAGPLEGYVGVPYDFIADSNPPTTTLPVDYLWQVTGQPTLTVTNGLVDTQTFSWNSPGVKDLDVWVTNAAGSVTATHSIEIGLHTIYLPISLRTH